jgi:tRNA(Ile)-lysidine synthase
MQERLEHILFNEGLVKKTDRILCAVSGGADSIILATLLKDSGLKIGVAHCNFQLRGKESDADMAFVEEFCLTKNIKFHSTIFETDNISKLKKKSIQETARELRYDWFKEIRLSEGYDLLATGHNQTDNLETILINQIRGTGLQGLTGIPTKRGLIIRPLIQFSASEIRSYAKEKSIPYRDDSSNATTDYLRNKLRHNVLPQLRSIEPNIESIFSKNAAKTKESLDLLIALTQDFKTRYIQTKNGLTYIPIQALHNYPHPHLLLSKLLPTDCFNFDQLKDLVTSKSIGKYVEGDLHRLTKDREHYILSSIIVKPINPVRITESGTFTFGLQSIQVELVTFSTITFPISQNCCILDSSHLYDGIDVCVWEQSDVIQPFGMRGTKLVSDVFTDNKVAEPVKKLIPVFKSNNEIFWVGELCFSERFRMDLSKLSRSNKVCKITISSE